MDAMSTTAGQYSTKISVKNLIETFLIHLEEDEKRGKLNIAIQRPRQRLLYHSGLSELNLKIYLKKKIFFKTIDDHFIRNEYADNYISLYKS